MKQGDVYWVVISSSSGHEIKGKGQDQTRPCVVISPDVLNSRLRTVIVAPLTSSVQAYPFRTQVNFKGKKGEVVLDQLRAYDQNSKRFREKMGSLSVKEINNCLEKLREIFANFTNGYD